MPGVHRSKTKKRPYSESINPNTNELSRLSGTKSFPNLNHSAISKILKFCLFRNRKHRQVQVREKYYNKLQRVIFLTHVFKLEQISQKVIRNDFVTFSHIILTEMGRKRPPEEGKKGTGNWTA